MYGVTPAIVLYARDPVATRQFYETVGLAFVEEKHGEGPVHYAHAFPGLVLEIYPLRAGVVPKPCDSVALVLFGDAFERTVAGIKANQQLVQWPLRPGPLIRISWCSATAGRYLARRMWKKFSNAFLSTVLWAPPVWNACRLKKASAKRRQNLRR